MAKWQRETVPEHESTRISKRRRILLSPGDSIQDLAAADPDGVADKIKKLLTAVVTRDAKSVANGDAADEWIRIRVSVVADFYDEDPSG